MYMFLVDTKHYFPIKWMAVTGNPRDFTIRGPLWKNHIHISRQLLWETLEMN